MSGPIVHGSSDLLQRFARGELDGPIRDAVVDELAQCAECRAIVGALGRGATDANDTRTSPPRREGGMREPMGSRIAGRYRIEAVLGEGGMGVVYRVEHELLGRLFALKMLRPERARHEPSVRRFLLEARALASVGHVGIVDVVDVGSDEHGRPFLVMPLLDGETLEARLGREPRLPLAEALTIASGILEALAAAHARGVVHRDVKPANVFLVRGAPSMVKLLDFGLAKLQRDVAHATDATLTHTGALLGTPRYMAPEQWTDPGETDARADVYAWGVTVYRMLAGSFPYQAVPPPIGARADLRRERAEVPIGVADLVERATAPSSRERPIDARALVAPWKQVASRVAPLAVSMPAPRSRAKVASHAAVSVFGRRTLVVDLADRIDAGARVVAVVGSEGIGKTTVLGSLRDELRVRGYTVLEPRATAMPTRDLAPLEAMLDDASAEGPRELAIRSLLARPRHVVCLDAPSWLDRASAALLLAAARDGVVRIVLESREDETLGGSPLEIESLLGIASRIRLPGLDADAVAQLAEARGIRLGASDLAALVARTGGHPLFVLTCLALHEERTRGDHEEEVPADLADAILARLSAAPANEARAWQLAAVLGDAITADDLRGLGVADADGALAWMVARDVLRVAPDGPPHHSFTAGLLAEVAQSSLAPDDAAHLHRGAALLRTRQLRDAQAPEAWARIAYHHERASDLASAADAYAVAALGPRAARAPGSAPEASSWGQAGFDRRARWASVALELASRASVVRDDRGELALARVEGLAGEGRFAEASAAIDAIDPAALTPETRARALVEQGTYLQRAGRHEDALEVLSAAVEAARAAGDHAISTLALAIGRHAVSLALAGRVDRARDRLWEAEEIVLSRAPSRRADLAGWKAQVAGLSGDLAERRDAYWATVELFRAEGNARFAAFSLLNLGDTYARLGAYDEAERALSRAGRECHALGATTMAGYAALNLGYVLTRLGRGAEARASIASARAIAERADDRRLARYTVLYAAKLWLERDAIDALARLDDDEHAVGHDVTWAALRETTLAEAALDAGRTEDALAHARRARAKADGAGALEEGEADVDLALVRALEASGAHEEARVVVARGTARIRDVARRIAGAHWRAFFLEDVPAHRELLARAARHA